MMNWVEIQAQVGVLSAHGQVALLAAMRRNEQELYLALKAVSDAMAKIEKLRQEGSDPTGG